MENRPDFDFFDTLDMPTISESENYDFPRRQDYDIPKQWEHPSENTTFNTESKWESGVSEDNVNDDFSEPPDAIPKPVPRYKNNRYKKELVHQSLFDVPSQTYQVPIWPPMLAPQGSDSFRVPRNEERTSYNIDQLEKKNNCEMDDEIPLDYLSSVSKCCSKLEENVYEQIPDLDTSSRELELSPTLSLTKAKKKMKSSSGKLALHAMRIKELSGSLFSVLTLNDGVEVNGPTKGSKNIAVPVCLIEKGVSNNFKRACCLYFEGAMAVGKSTMITHLQQVIEEDSIITFPEPMYYWTKVYNNVLKQIYKLNKYYRVGKESASAELLACQVKFMTPLKTMWSFKQRCMHPDSPSAPVTPFDKWVIFDRHPLSATVVFPLILLKRGMLSFNDFINLLNTFTAANGDTIVLMSLDIEVNYKRLKRRFRKYEGFVDLAHLKEVKAAFHATYCAWLFLQYFSVTDVVKICTALTDVRLLCQNNNKGKLAYDMAYRIWSKSIFATLEEVIRPFSHDCTLIEICTNFCYELQKLQFIVVDVSEFEDDVTGAWTNIYTQAMKNSGIKTHVVDWSALKNLSKEAYKQLNG
ncbi:thymidine kinase [Suid gammaherpesvirus 3]|uniref:Thymidine kinase n=1 Tax=Suid gammaherpesvirus 3 TaxID=1960249 RepID=Q8JYD0_9GAMA|nr:thymidine kinase [Porcine lymphotropic herpesvirus 1]AAM22121.1 thymidine kinase [Porcine lymphotropic herpesvirus 1]